MQFTFLAAANAQRFVLCSLSGFLFDVFSSGAWKGGVRVAVPGGLCEAVLPVAAVGASSPRAVSVPSRLLAPCTHKPI